MRVRAFGHAGAPVRGNRRRCGCDGARPSTASSQDSSHLGRPLVPRRRSPPRRRSGPACASSAAAAARRRSSCSGSTRCPGSTQAPAQLLAATAAGGTPAPPPGTPALDRQRALDVDLEEHVVAGGEVLLDRARGACPSGRRRPRTTRGSRRRRAAASNSLRGRRSGSRRRRPRPGAAARVVAETDNQRLGSRSSSRLTIGALADPRRAGEHEQDAPGQALRTIFGMASSSALALVAPEAAQPTALADVELLHDAGAPAPCRRRAATRAR